MDKVTIITSWDGSDYYAAEYVNRLYRACVWNISTPFDFVLYAGPAAEKRQDEIVQGIKIVPVGLPYWWAGMPAWQFPAPGVETNTRLFIDLDVVITGSLDLLLTWPSDFCCSRDWASHNAPPGHEHDANPGVTLLRGDAGAWVWDAYVKAGKPVHNPHDPSIDHSPCHMAAQGIINNRQGWAVDLFPQEVCTSYKLTVKRHGLPAGCRTVHFHGRPKQHEVDEPWIKESWR